MQNPQKPFTESGSSPPVPVTVTTVQVTPGCRIGRGEAFDHDGRAVSFVADWRQMLLIAEALEAGNHVEVWLHGGEIVSWDSWRRS